MMTKVEKRDEFLASEVKELALEVGYAECAVVEVATDNVTVEAVLDAENADKYYCVLENGVLHVDTSEANKRISLTDKNRSAVEKQEVTIYVPCGMKLQSLDLSVGAGTARLKNTSTVYGKADIEVGAGKLEAVSLVVEGHTDIDVGAGAASIANLTAPTADIACGVGKMSVKGAIA